MTNGGGGRKAAFVDRDGTVIREREYLADPEGVELLPGTVPGLRRLHDAGYAIVLVTNQSGIARGFYSEDDYERVQARVVSLLGDAGVPILASYHCPHHPDHGGPCDCRKPAPGLFLRAAREHDLALAGAPFIGDRLRDVTPALPLGGRPVLVRTGYGRQEEAAAPPGVAVADTLEDAARALLDDRPDR